MTFVDRYGIDNDPDYDEEDFPVTTMTGRFTAQQNQLRRMLREASRKANMFNQDEVWVNADGRYIPIREISARYAENIMEHLQSHMMEDAEAVYLWNTRELPHAMEFNYTVEDCRGWLESTPLYSALREASARPF